MARGIASCQASSLRQVTFHFEKKTLGESPKMSPKRHFWRFSPFFKIREKLRKTAYLCGFLMVGMTGFEPATTSSLNLLLMYCLISRNINKRLCNAVFGGFIVLYEIVRCYLISLKIVENGSHLVPRLRIRGSHSLFKRVPGFIEVQNVMRING